MPQLFHQLNPEAPALDLRPVISQPFALDAVQQSWVDATFARLSPRQRIGQLLHPFLPAAGPELERFLSLSAELGIGGYFQGGGMGSRELREVFTRAAETWPVPPLVSGDYECGAAIAGAPGMGTALSLAGIADLSEAELIAESLGRSVAEQGVAVGTRWTFAPVVDISYCIDNPIVNTRSFGDDPHRVAVLAAAFVRGAQSGGMACTMKHFPGDGMDQRDQHLVTTVNTMPIERWHETYGKTFGAAMQAGVAACMIGHIALAGVSGSTSDGRLLPGTLDPRIQRDLLRGELGFRGVIVSDAIGMGGMKAAVLDEPGRVVGNLRAGSDVVLFPLDLAGSLAAIENALVTGELHRDLLDDSCQRVLALKARFGLHQAPLLCDESACATAVSYARHAPLCCTVAERSLTLVRDTARHLPLRLVRGSKVVCLDLPNEGFSMHGLVVAGQEQDTLAFAPFDDALRAAGLRVKRVQSHAAWKAEIVDADAYLMFAHTRATAGRGSIRLSYTAQQLVENTRDHRPMPTALCLMGNPYVAWELAMLPTVIACYANSDDIQRHLAACVLGTSSFVGRLPVQLPQLV